LPLFLLREPVRTFAVDKLLDDQRSFAVDERLWLGNWLTNKRNNVSSPLGPPIWKFGCWFN